MKAGMRTACRVLAYGAVVAALFVAALRYVEYRLRKAFIVGSYRIYLPQHDRNAPNVADVLNGMWMALDHYGMKTGEWRMVNEEVILPRIDKLLMQVRDEGASSYNTNTVPPQMPTLNVWLTNTATGYRLIVEISYHSAEDEVAFTLVRPK
ncbi:hypothetical protein [Limisphaera sp. 4302-co]|uniref:hypothetical protein n=1 Tax=Limisphaera sp. 4302-co TaxID=3400417 RepID=UPI003C1F786A